MFVGRSIARRFYPFVFATLACWRFEQFLSAPSLLFPRGPSIRHSLSSQVLLKFTGICNDVRHQPFFGRTAKMRIKDDMQRHIMAIQIITRSP